MPIPAVRFRLSSRDATPIAADLAVESAGELGRLRDAEAPAAYVVRDDDLDGLRRLEEIVIDRGRKHPAKGLATLLLRHQRIPLIEGSYKDPGQLVRSVRTLLRNAVDRRETNLYVIGVDGVLFERVRERAAAFSTPPAAGADRVAIPASPAPDEHEPPPLLSLLPPREIPAELGKRFVGRSPEAHLVRQLILIAAEHDDPSLVLGSTGTGKEVVARAIHDYSERRTQAFVPVNCGAIPGDLVESELFGHLPGSFTGAARRKEGLWKAAHRGTIFLDEIGDLPASQQVKILRAIEQGTIRPVGAESEIKIDARVIAATNRDLFAMVQAGEFREDLYYRLRAFMIRTPALRDHPQDIPVLASFFWRSITKDPKATLPTEISEALCGYRWPGNARELRAVLAHLHALFGRQRLAIRHLRAVFALEGQVIAAPRPDEREIDLHRVECLRHLRRADEVIRVVEVSLAATLTARAGAGDEALAGGRGTAAVGETGVVVGEIARLRSELELLCHRPLLFHGEAAYSAVSRLRDVLAHLSDYGEGDPRSARAYWQREGEPALGAARSTVLRSVEQLIKRAPR